MLGPSGCGKTTTLRMIAGFEAPTSGAIRLEGQDVSRVPPYKRNVNTVFQQYALFPHMSVWDNVAFGPKSKKVGGDEIKRRVGELLEVVRLTDFAHRKPNQLSGGQQQRVALARALVELPERAAARRAARGPRPEAAPGDAARAEAHPARGRHHVRVRDARPGRGAHDERPHRGHERGAGRADRRAARDLRRSGVGVRRRLHRRREPVPSFRRRLRRRRRDRRCRWLTTRGARRSATRHVPATPRRSWFGRSGCACSWISRRTATSASRAPSPTSCSRDPSCASRWRLATAARRSPTSAPTSSCRCSGRATPCGRVGSAKRLACCPSVASQTTDRSRCTSRGGLMRSRHRNRLVANCAQPPAVPRTCRCGHRRGRCSARRSSRPAAATMTTTVGAAGAAVAAARISRSRTGPAT